MFANAGIGAALRGPSEFEQYDKRAAEKTRVLQENPNLAPKRCGEIPALVGELGGRLEMLNAQVARLGNRLSPALRPRPDQCRNHEGFGAATELGGALNRLISQTEAIQEVLVGLDEALEL